jgi:CRP-like cAMP-binding protein
VSDHRGERLRAAIRSLPMFRGLSPQDHERIEPIASIRDLAKGDVLWNAGDSADTLTVILRGRVKVVGHGSAGDVILEIFGEGEPVGSIAVYNRMPYPASAVALEPVALICMPARDFFDLLDRHPDLSRNLIRELTRLNLALTHKLEEMRGQRVDVRIAQLFLTLAGRMGRTTPEGVDIPIALTRLEVAELVGTTVESAIRVLSRWGREGLLITRDGGFLAPSLENLRACTASRPDA